MKKYVKFSVITGLLLTLTACVGEEPNDIAYITALGIDKNENGFKYTIQFANPTKISGGAAEQGGSGGNIVENITVEGPTIYSGLNSADAIVSKDLSLAHAKIIVVSEEIAREGLSGFAEVISRNNDIRPDVYLAVSEDAGKYLESVKPVIELNPVKYYQLTYGNKKGGPLPQKDAADFFMAVRSGDIDCPLPLAGVAGIKEENQGTDAGSQEGGKDEQSEDNKKSKEAGINQGNFQKGTKDYFAGEAGVKIKNKGETLGLAVFKRDRYIGKLGGTDALIYNILQNNIRDTEIVFQLNEEELPITVRVDEKYKPCFKIDKDTKTVRIEVRLEGELISAPRVEGKSKTVEDHERECGEYIDIACNDFLKRVYNEMDADILGIRGKIKRQFQDNKSYEEYIRNFSAKEWNMSVKTDLSIKRAGMTY